MKIQCDVCSKAEASIFCSADEAALCDICDQRVHRANKLAGKHVRFALVNPSNKESPPLCDICKERRALLFCQEDRAILCRECDIPIHKSNKHTQNHNRFLLTGVKLSPPSSSFSSSSSSCAASSSSNDIEIKPSISNQFSSYNVSSNQSDMYQCAMNNFQDQSNSMSTSSISEYLIETLPGYRVDDFLDPSSHGFCKISDSQTPFPDYVFDPNSYPSFANSAMCVPQAPPQLTGNEQNASKISRKWILNGSRVPKTSHSLKKSRNFG